MPSLRNLLAGGLLVLSGALLFQACGSQGEGMRCEENKDCESGLTCEQRSCCTERICCPASGAETTSECKGAPVAATEAGTNETSVPSETGAADADDAEAAAEGGTDTGTPDTGADADAGD